MVSVQGTSRRPVPAALRKAAPRGRARGLVRAVAGWVAAAALAAAAAAHAHEGHRSGRAPRPALAVSAVFSPDGRLWVAGLDERRRLFVQSSADDGRSWGPRTLPDLGDEVVAADGEQRPKIAFGPDGRTVILAWTRPLARPYTGEIRMARSEDGGRRFGAPFTVHADRQPITHRFESIAFDVRGRLHVLWVDKRDAEAARAAAAVAGRAKADWPGAAIWRVVSEDGGRSFSPDLRVADHSCECCRIALAPSPDGGIAAMWRHVFDGRERDHAFARIGGADAPSPATVRASADRWAVDACPHHGPGLAAADGGGYHAVWFGERDGVGAVRYGRLTADGAPAGDAVALPDPGAEHADVIAAGGRVAVVWRSFDGVATRLRAWVSDDGGTRFALRELARSPRENDHPRLARRGDRLVAVWRTDQEIRVVPLD
ncbi:MAG: hypothetical protein RJA99_2654 [Pseudomonadota bacterium]|jgi:hypothetical protein